MIDATHGSQLGDQDRSPKAQSTIIAAVGPSGGETTIGMARAVAAADASSLIVVSVVAFPPFNELVGGDSLLKVSPIEEQRIERLQAEHRRLTHLAAPGSHEGAVEVAILYGSPAATIANLARERRARLIVLGAGQRGAIARLFAPDTALETSRRAPCPVLVVYDGAVGLPTNVVVAIDFSPTSLHAAMRALAFVADGATVHLVHVWRRIRTLVPLATLQDFDERYEQSLPARFERVRSLLGSGRSFLFKNISREGPTEETILNVARTADADLIVTGTRGLGTIERLLIGSVSTALLRGSDCSVILVPPPLALERARIERHMTGTSSVTAPDEWGAELEAFASRNDRRRTVLEIDDHSIGAQIQTSGYALAGATYDRHDRRVALMFRQPARSGDHLTHSIGNVRSVAVASAADDGDTALSIESEHGSALLTFITPRSVKDSI